MIRKIKAKRKLYIAVFLSIFLSSIIIIMILNKKAMPIVMNYANIQTKKIAIEVLRDTGLKEVNRKINESKLLEMDKDNNGQIESININTPALNEILVIVAKSVREKLKEVEKGVNLPDELYPDFLDKKFKNGMIYSVPLHVVFNNIFLSNLGPKIPVKIEYSGNVGLDVKTHVKSYGINSALIEVYINVDVTQRTILPFKSKEAHVTSEIPVIMKVIKGNIPNYISGENFSYSLPMN